MTAAPAIAGLRAAECAAELGFDAEGLARLRSKVQTWAPYIDGLLLADLAVVLDDYMPGKDESEVLGGRLRGHLMRLVRLSSRLDRRGDVPSYGNPVRARQHLLVLTRHQKGRFR
ncbi:hypothetical protein ACIQNG_15035 [Streptomyces sp. NPDC091377]|uniref:hypothetical protein n=1 Tax=Streptomyces sp. NPDC091377 TaxID=3365995 RepID=UPI0038098E86